MFHIAVLYLKLQDNSLYIGKASMFNYLTQLI